MAKSTFIPFIISTSLCIYSCTALVNRATSFPFAWSVQAIGRTTQADPSYDDVYRDGGGGGYINGNHLIVFSDTSTINSNDQLVGFTSNSVAFSNSNTPTVLTDFGSNGVPNLGIPFMANETAATAQLESSGSRVAIWPGSSIAPINSQTGLAVYGVTIIDKTGAGTALYSTMVQYQPTSSGPGASRLVPALFFPGETQYGNWANTLSRGGNWLFLFSNVNLGTGANGIKVARVRPQHAADRTQYQYWDGTVWAATPKTESDLSDAIVTNYAPFSSGDFIYSPYLGTWVLVYFDGWASNTFYVRYSLSGTIVGPWSDLATLYTTTPSSKVYNYAGHAYSGYDASGQSVLLSWTYNGGETFMATVTFA